MRITPTNTALLTECTPIIRTQIHNVHSTTRRNNINRLSNNINPHRSSSTNILTTFRRRLECSLLKRLVLEVTAMLA
jgi:hypothetical protein